MTSLFLIVVSFYPKIRFFQRKLLINFPSISYDIEKTVLYHCMCNRWDIAGGTQRGRINRHAATSIHYEALFNPNYTGYCAKMISTFKNNIYICWPKYALCTVDCCSLGGARGLTVF